MNVSRRSGQLAAVAAAVVVAGGGAGAAIAASSHHAPEKSDSTHVRDIANQARQSPVVSPSTAPGPAGPTPSPSPRRPQASEKTRARQFAANPDTVSVPPGRGGAAGADALAHRRAAGSDALVHGRAASPESVACAASRADAEPVSDQEISRGQRR